MPSNPLRNNADDIHKAISSSPEAPKIHGDIGTLGIHDWESLSVPHCIAAGYSRVWASWALGWGFQSDVECGKA